MNYFAGINTLDELKQAYKKLAMENHPDRGGDVEVMKAINNEYEAMTEKLKNGKGETAKSYSSAVEFKDILDKIINFDINIEICGSWLWVDGNTYAVKESLKESGFKWASKKKKWYWKPQDDMRSRRTNWSMEQIRDKYGSQSVKSGSRKYSIA